MNSWISASLCYSRIKQRPSIAASLLSNFPLLLFLHTSTAHSFYWMGELNLKSAKRRILQLTNVMLMVPFPKVAWVKQMQVSARDKCLS